MIVRRLDENHDMSFGDGISNFATNAEAVAQRCKTRLLLLKEEWFLDLDAGVPYLQDIMVKPSNLPLTEAVIKQTILEDEEIVQINSFTMTFDRNTRTLSIASSVTTIYDELVDIKVTR